MHFLGSNCAGWALCLSLTIWGATTSAIPRRAFHQPIARQDSEIESIIAESPLLTLHRDLVEIESISDDEGDVGEWLAEYLEDHDFTVDLIEVPVPGNSSVERWNLYATQDASVTPRVILTTHLDVVAPHIPYSASYSNSSDSRDDIMLQGRGSVDAKCNVAAQTIAAIELLESGDVSAGEVALLFVVGEENSGAGMMAFSNSSLYANMSDTIQGFIFGEPTEGKLGAGHKGVAGLLITANGTTAHSAYPWNGDSAITKILPALLAVDGLDSLTPEEGGLPGSEKFGNSTTNIGVLEAGTAPNVVPGYAMARASIRVAGGTPEEFEAAIEARIAEYYEGEIPVQFNFTWSAGPVDLVSDVEGFEPIILNYATDILGLDYGDDIKVYLYGPGTIEVAHGVDEFVRLGDLEKAVEDFKLLVADVLGS
ncbi:hypothetical protein B0A52_01242 [Exophiala mesophila]|uniref:Biotin carboxylation domain-containing protein n=1 Tax=Exophiala mesophila TaxID=212818 RepID=A0A438NGV7_EXOME|nr:hypothetical protein B0A52_01242 [Exophiala mesophila]